MTGPTATATATSSWMQAHDMSHSGRSEAWSELLGLRSNPRTVPGPMPPGGALFMHPHSSAGPADSRSWTPAFVEPRGRKSLDSIFAALPSSRSETQACPPSAPLPVSGLHTLDPLFASAASSASGSRIPGLLSPVPSSSSLQGDISKALSSTLSPVASHPLLRAESVARMGRMTPVGSQGSLSGDVSFRRPPGPLSPSPSDAGLQQEVYRRAALDFVLELAGPHVPAPGSADTPCASRLVGMDDLPIPAFAIDRDAQVSVWNRQLAELSGWEEEDMTSGSVSLGYILQPCSSGNSSRTKGCMELMRSVLFGMVPPPGAKFFLLKKAAHCQRKGKAAGLQEPLSVSSPRRPSMAGGRSPSADSVPVELRLNRRTDAVGAVCGVVCLVVPISTETGAVGCDACKRPGISGVGQAVMDRTPERKAAAGSMVERGSVFSQSPSSIGSSLSWGSVSGAGAAKAVHQQQVTCATPPAGHEVGALTSPEALTGSPSMDSGVPEVHALVMESVDAVRIELTQNLERCGVEVTSCASLGEAMWRFERGLSEASEPRFDLIFLELQPSGDDLYLAIRDLRRLEEEARILGQVPHLEGVLQCSSAVGSRDAVDAAAPASASGCAPASADGSLPCRVSLGESSLGENSGDERSEDGEDNEVALHGKHRRRVSDEEADSSDLACSTTEPGGMCSSSPDSLQVYPPSEAAEIGEVVTTVRSAWVHGLEHRCLILAMVNMNRWDLAGLDVAMEQCVRAGGDAVIPRSMPLQQLKTALKKLGVRSKYLMFPSRLPRALSGNLHNPLNMSR